MSDKKHHWGFNAYGMVLPLEVSLYERDDARVWELEMLCGAMTIAVHLDSPKEVALILAFMSENYGRTKSRAAEEGEFTDMPAGTKIFSEVASMRIKTSGDVEALMSKDGERADRFCVSVVGKGVRFHADLVDPETSKLISALRQVAGG